MKGHGMRDIAVEKAHANFDSGAFRENLARKVAFETESQNPAKLAEVLRYLTDELEPEFNSLGFRCYLLRQEATPLPFLFAERIESPEHLTVLGYGHGDVIAGQHSQWEGGLAPFVLTESDGCWYGRGIADNKGQHAINLAALRAVLETRGHLGFNAKYLIEMGEEMGSPGLHELVRDDPERFTADLLIASDGPRLSKDRATIFLGARGSLNLHLEIVAREGAHHSGNWGGLLSNPAIQLAHALAVIVGPSGRILIPELVPSAIPENVREALLDCQISSDPRGPQVDEWWGEPGLSSAEKVYGWCNFEVLAMEAGNPSAPQNAIPGRAWARCQLRFVVGVDVDRVIPAIEAHLQRHGFDFIGITPARDKPFHATRLNPDNPWVRLAMGSIQRTTGKRPALLPNLGGALPNEVFADILQLPTIWIPHSYPGCSQHAPNEHLPTTLIREALGIMAGVYFDLGDLTGTPTA
jgi:acetylornithine deacetylase/succinyl-diaminopimelate desuccinylase-like protein